MAETANQIRDSASQAEDVSDPNRFPPVGIAEITQLANSLRTF